MLTIWYLIVANENLYNNVSPKQIFVWYMIVNIPFKSCLWDFSRLLPHLVEIPDSRNWRFGLCYILVI